VRGAAGRRPSPCAVALALVLLAGCATRPAPPAGLEILLLPGAARRVVDRWEAARRDFTGLRGVVDLTMRKDGRRDRASALLLLAPERLRLEITTPFGFPSLVASVTPERIVVFQPGERTAWTAPPTPEALARWLGTPVAPATLIGLLAGRVPLPADPQDVRVEADGGPHLAWSRGIARHRAWVTPGGQPARLSLDNGDSLTVAFTWGPGGIPGRVVVEAPGRRAEVTLSYLTAEYAAPAAEAFELVLPAGVRIERLD